MKLYDHPVSPYAMKIRAILYEKGIDFENAVIEQESDREELLRLNPRAEVPALVDGDVVLYDSKIIAEYLEETHPRPALVPATAAGRARCRALELAADTQADAATIALALFKFFRPGLAAEHPAALASAEAALRRLFADFDRHLAGRDFLLGEFGRADIALAPHVGACGFLGFTPDDSTPSLAAWVARVNERPSIRRVTEEAVASLSTQVERPFFDSSRLHWRSDRLEHLVRIGLGDWLLAELATGRGFLPPLP